MVGFPCVGSRLRTWFLTTFVLKLMARQTNRDGLQVFEAPSGFPDTSKYSFCPLGAAEGRQSNQVDGPHRARGRGPRVAVGAENIAGRGGPDLDNGRLRALLSDASQRRATGWGAAFVEGVTAAATGAIAGAAVVLGRRAIVDLPTIALASATFLVIWKARRIPEPVIIPVAGIIGWLLKVWVLR